MKLLGFGGKIPSKTIKAKDLTVGRDIVLPKESASVLGVEFYSDKMRIIHALIRSGPRENTIIQMVVPSDQELEKL